MRTDRQPRRRNPTQYSVPHVLAVVEFLSVGGLEPEPDEMEHLHLRTVARGDRRFIYMPSIGQHITRPLFTAGEPRLHLTIQRGAPLLRHGE